MDEVAFCDGFAFLRHGPIRETGVVDVRVPVGAQLRSPVWGHARGCSGGRNRMQLGWPSSLRRGEFELRRWRSRHRFRCVCVCVCVCERLIQPDHV